MKILANIIDMLTDTKWEDQFSNVFHFYKKEGGFYLSTSPTNEVELKCRIEKTILVCETDFFGKEKPLALQINEEFTEMKLISFFSPINVAGRILKRIFPI